MIDLHLHTTASDGALAPSALVARAAAAGITTLAVTDHDTTRGLDEARAAASTRGMRLVNGIEITAVEGDRDVHVLGYFFDPGNAALRSFLAAQTEDRIRRVKAMAEQLAVLGVAIDAEQIVREGVASGRSVGRPHIAAALLAAGHVQTRDEAFDRFLENGRPAFIPRRGAPPDEVIGIIAAAGGVASLAHPGLAGMDAILPRLAGAGLHALEVRHTDHDVATEARYRELAADLGLAVSAGSDFHDDTGRRRCGLGQVTLTAQEFAALEARRA